MCGRQWRWCVLFGAGIAALALACSSFESDVRSGTDGGTDGGPTLDAENPSPDGATVDDASANDGGDGGPRNLLVDGFEDGFACTNWKGLNARLSREDAGRSGLGACRLCMNQNGTGGAYQDLAGAGSGTYQFDAWTRLGAASASSYVNLILLVADGGTAAAPASSGITQGATWQTSAVAVKTAENIGAARLRIMMEGSTDSCIVIDDVTVVHQP